MAEDKKEQIDPLSITLDKGVHGDEDAFDTEKPAGKTGDKDAQALEKRRIAQKELLQAIYKRIDERINNHPGLRQWKPSWAFILILLLAFPFFLRMGTDFYDLAKVQLPAYFGLPPLGAPEPPASKSVAKPAQTAPEKPGAKVESGVPPKMFRKLLEQNSQIIIQNKDLLEKISKMPKPVNRVSNKVIIIRDEPGIFSFEAEKTKIYEIGGVDFDDPIAGTKALKDIKSIELLLVLVGSFNRILLNADDHPVSDFHIKNAIDGKRQAMERLRELK
ncbi:MAG: hypothetical protein V3S46_02370 [Nitrospinota bacterium]